MLSLPSSVRIYLGTQPADMRRSFDGLAFLVQQFLQGDPLSGHLFVFRNKAGDRIKVLFWDGDGYVIYYKRLEAGTFQQLDPQARSHRVSGSAGIELTVTELALLEEPAC